MISFFLSIAALLAGYFVYSKIVDRNFGAEPNRTTPAIRLEDGVDFVKMPFWKIFLVQFLNIAGLGPIFGAIAGALRLASSAASAITARQPGGTAPGRSQANVKRCVAARGRGRRGRR